MGAGLLIVGVVVLAAAVDVALDAGRGIGVAGGGVAGGHAGAVGDAALVTGVGALGHTRGRACGDKHEPMKWQKQGVVAGSK